jgi:site-specific DNA-methyltransferase (adenine-specific)
MTWSVHHGEAWSWLRELPSSSAQALITDPPYSSGGFTRGDRTADPAEKYRKAGAAESTESFSGDNRDQRSFGLWCATWLTEAHRVLVDGAPVALATDWRQLPTVCDALQVGGFIWRGIVTWTKNNAGRPCQGRFRADAEFFVWGSKGAMAMDGSPLPGTFHDVDMLQSACIDVTPVRFDKRLHLTEKPVPVMEAVLAIVRSGLVLDPFTGSGSTGVACLRRGLDFAGCELSDHYHALAVERLRAEEQGISLQAARSGQGALFG